MNEKKRKRVTSQDVANLAGVSRTTVSFVLNRVENVHIREETRQKVLAAAKSLGYVPNANAQALVRHRSQTIALVVTRSPHHIASDSFLPKIIAGLVEVIQPYDLRLLIEWVSLEGQYQTYSQLVRAKRIDGLIITTPRLDDASLGELAEVGVPAVLIGNNPESNLYSVDIDNQAAARLAVEYLIRLGHRQIACITNAPRSYSAAVERLQGYLDALQSAAIVPDESLIRYGNFDPESGYEQMRSLLQSGHPFSAVFVASDNVAIGAKAAIREQGMRVPADISIVGFDDIPWAQYADPPLTTVRLPAIELAKTAAQMLVELLEGESSVPRNVLLEVELVERKSCLPR
ncbi:MAG: LacI family DNA-binding transcriptional regulator [Anaerolineales bacterium]